MKKIISLSLVLMLLLGILAVPAVAEEAQPKPVGTLSYLVMTEEEDLSFSAATRLPLLKLLRYRGVLVPKKEGGTILNPRRFFDTLDALLMALQAGELDNIKLPYYSARYLCSTNDGIKIITEYHPEKATGIAEWALGMLSDGYSFMMKEENTALRDEFDAQITAMKEDGTLQKLIDEHIVKVAEGGEPVSIAFEKFDGDPIKVAVTGDLPPMDYVAPDGTFAGFNTAVLAEIGKRLQKNIELVQVENVGRALVLSQGLVDVVFWTRALSESLVLQITTGEKLSDIMAQDQALTDEEKALLETLEFPDQETIEKMYKRDLPEGTIITQPYFSDYGVRVGIK
jgi:ABC-type amino acid transport substrate-binding protein